MTFDGYLERGGVELINAERTTAYINNLMPSFGLFRRTADYDNIHVALGHAEYRSPFLDQADWVETDGADDPDPRNPTHGFYGLYPLSIEGFGDSTATASVVQGILDGGNIGAERDSTRSLRIRGLLVGQDRLAVEHGLVWLRNALRENACGMHGDQCGYTDLRFFLAPPDVCDPLWPRTYNAEQLGIPMGTLDVATSPLIYSHGVEGQPHSAEWILAPTDGVKIRWGALAFDGAEELESHGPVYLRRTNFIANPGFALNTASWSGVGGTVTRVAVTDPYAHMDQTSPVTHLTNWLPDPSFEHGDPQAVGWRASGDVVDTTDGTAPQGSKVAVLAASPDPIWLETSMLGPFDEGTTGVFSFWTRHDDDITVTVTDNSGVLIFSEDITGLADAWQRVDVTDVPVLRNYSVRITTAGTDELRVDGMMLTATPTLQTYFDGDTADGGGSTYDFVGGFSGPSRKDTGTDSSFAISSATTDAPFGPVVLTFSMRATESEPSVLVEILDPTDSLISSMVVAPGTNWSRFALGANFGRQVKVRFTSATGAFDLDSVMLEAGSEINPYFSASDVAPDGYSLVWLGTQNNSASRLTWLGSTLVSRDSNFRPFLEVQQGSVTGVLLDLHWSEEIDMSFQLEPYDRTYHRVGTTRSVERIRDYPLDVGAATEVDFILTAATPHAFSTQFESIEFDDDDPTFISDQLINHISTNPKAFSSATGWSNTGTGSTAPAASSGVYTTTTTTGLAAGAFGLTRDKVIGTGASDLKPNTVYRFSIDMKAYLAPSTLKSARLSVSGSGVAVAGLGTYSATDWTTRSVTFTTGASGTVTFSVLNGEATVAGTNTVYARYAILTEGDDTFGFFDGDTTDTDAYTYSWDGTAGASLSRRSYTVETVNPLIDPDLPVVPSPPAPPVVPDVAITEQNEWLRYRVVIPQGNVALWAGTVPTLTLKTLTSDVRQVRVRFHPNPFGWDVDQIDPTDYCGEFLLSYLPQNSSLVISGVTREAYATVAGSPPQPANHLLYGTGGTPMDWPELSCGIEYVMTVDIPPGVDIDNLDIDLIVNRRE